MTYLSEFLTLGVIGILGVLAPGPDFVLVTQSSLQKGKKAGIFTAFGIALGCLVHVSYCVIGIAVIVSESLLLFSCIKYLGAAYLIYLGWKGITTKTLTQPEISVLVTPESTSTAQAAIKKGFLVNLLNPKATLFFLSVFTQVIDPQTPRLVQSLYGLEFSLIAFAWFSALACILANAQLKRKLMSVQPIIEKILGIFLIGFGLKVATYIKE